MTSTKHAAPLRFDSTRDAFAELRRRGMRLSAARRLVLEVLYRADRLLSAEEIAGGLDDVVPGSDLASVYRNLETLEEIGLVRHVHFGHRAGLYALQGRGACEYLVCEFCGHYQTISVDALNTVRAEIRSRFGFEAHFAHFPITGACQACASRYAAEPEPQR